MDVRMLTFVRVASCYVFVETQRATAVAIKFSPYPIPVQRTPMKPHGALPP